VGSALQKTLAVASALAIISGCALNSPERVKQNLTEADKQCSTRTDWPNTVAKVACYDAAEEPVIRQKVPAALPAFQRFSETRRKLAEQADIINAKGIEQSAKYRSSLVEALAVLKAHEPKLADNSSTLIKEWTGAKASSVCQQAFLSEQVNCIGSILRPIWERDAPDTLGYYDEYQQKHLSFARTFDASGALETKKRASEYLARGIKEAVSEFRENAQRDIQAANAQDAAARQQASKEFAEILVGVAAVALAFGEGYAQAASYSTPTYSQPTHCVSRQVVNTVYTDCQ